jgi:hypothetical protein
MLPLIRKKAGETITIGIHVDDDADAPLDLTGYTVTSHARLRSDTSDGAPLAVATVTVADQTELATRGDIEVRFDASVTATWPPMTLVDYDVSFEIGGDVALTDTGSIDVGRAVTR